MVEVTASELKGKLKAAPAVPTAFYAAKMHAALAATLSEVPRQVGGEGPEGQAAVGVTATHHAQHAVKAEPCEGLTGADSAATNTKEQSRVALATHAELPAQKRSCGTTKSPKEANKKKTRSLAAHVVADKFGVNTDALNVKISEWLRKHVMPRLKDPSLVRKVTTPASCPGSITLDKERLKEEGILTWQVLEAEYLEPSEDEEGAPAKKRQRVQQAAPPAPPGACAPNPTTAGSAY